LVDYGLKTLPPLELSFQFSVSPDVSGSVSTGDDLTIYSQIISAEFLLGRFHNIGFTFGIGPGIYLFDEGKTKLGRFSLHMGFGTALWLRKVIRLGVDARIHRILSGRLTRDNFWTVMARLGYLFDIAE